jgi:hypothetical protein
MNGKPSLLADLSVRSIEFAGPTCGRFLQTVQSLMAYSSDVTHQNRVAMQPKHQLFERTNQPGRRNPVWHSHFVPGGKVLATSLFMRSGH